MKRCVGVWWLSGRRQGTCRPLTDATLWRTGALQIFWEDFGAGPLNAAGGLCKKRQSFAQPTHGPQARHLSPKKNAQKVHLRTQTDPLTPKTTHERSSPIQ